MKNGTLMTLIFYDLRGWVIWQVIENSGILNMTQPHAIFTTYDLQLTAYDLRLTTHYIVI